VDLAGGRHNIISTPSPSIFFFAFSIRNLRRAPRYACLLLVVIGDTRPHVSD
jgi:hypothetical protein